LLFHLINAGEALFPPFLLKGIPMQSLFAYPRKEVAMRNGKPGKLGSGAERADNAAKAFGMSLKGMTNGQIGEEFGVSREAIRLLLKEYMDSLTTPLAEDMRRTEDDKLNRREALLWRLLDGKYKVTGHGKVVIDLATNEPVEDLEPIYKADAALGRIAERRAKLWGLDTPVTQEQNITYTSPIDESYKRLIEQMDARAQADIESL
jgi:hypothetical protein